MEAGIAREDVDSRAGGEDWAVEAAAGLVRWRRGREVEETGMVGG